MNSQTPLKQTMQTSNESNDMKDVAAARLHPASFEVLYNRYYNSVFRFVYRRVESKDEAADITQQVFLKAMQKLNTYRDQGLPFIAWLFRIAVNEMNMMFRKNKVQRTINLYSDEIPELLAETDTQANDDEKLYHALSRLDKENLWLIELRYFEKKSFAEIAQIVDLNESTTKTKLYRAIEKLSIIFKTL